MDDTMQKPVMQQEVNETAATLDGMSGAFVGSLRRNNKQIRDDRALAIAEEAQTLFKREIEDTELRIKRMKREREGLLDLSPADKNSLVLASEFDAKAFVDKDLKLGIDIRNLQIKLDVAKERYSYLFGSL